VSVYCGISSLWLLPALPESRDCSVFCFPGFFPRPGCLPQCVILGSPLRNPLLPIQLSALPAVLSSPSLLSLGEIVGLFGFPLSCGSGQSWGNRRPHCPELPDFQCQKISASYILHHSMVLFRTRTNLVPSPHHSVMAGNHTPPMVS
jgi:hypothetical protein